MKNKLESILDFIDLMIDSKPVALMNIALWVLFVCVVFFIGVI